MRPPYEGYETESGILHNSPDFIRSIGVILLSHGLRLFLISRQDKVDQSRRCLLAIMSLVKRPLDT